MKRNLFITITIFICFILQTTVFSVAGIRPNLLIIVTSAFGFMRGRKCGLLTGFFCGLLCDIFYGSVLGFYSLLFMYIGYINGFFKQIFYKDDIKLPILLITLSDLAYLIICYILLFLLRGRFHLGNYLVHIILPEIAYTILITLILYPLIRWINYLFDQEEQRRDDSFA